MTARVSIIMPCYNAAAHLSQTIDSVLAQTFDDWELVIVDDGSVDASWQILQEISGQHGRIRIFQQANAGAAAARNRALAEAGADNTAFLDADDTWHPEFLAKMMRALDKDPEATIAYCGWQQLGLSGGRGEPFVPPDYENTEKVEALFRGCRWPIHGALIRSSAVKDGVRFDLNLTSCMDYDLWLRLGAVYKLTRVPEVLAFYHHHEGEHITDNKARIAFNHFRVQQKFLRANPATKVTLGRTRVRELTHGEMLRRGYESYWDRNTCCLRCYPNLGIDRSSRCLNQETPGAKPEMVKEPADSCPRPRCGLTEATTIFQ